MIIVITYDVNNKNNELKKELILEGFNDRYQKDLVTHYLPDTTLISYRFDTLQQVQNIFEKIIEGLNVGVINENNITRATHFAAFQIESLVGTIGEEHT